MFLLLLQKRLLYRPRLGKLLGEKKASQQHRACGNYWKPSVIYSADKRSWCVTLHLLRPWWRQWHWMDKLTNCAEKPEKLQRTASFMFTPAQKLEILMTLKNFTNLSVDRKSLHTSTKQLVNDKYYKVQLKSNCMFFLLFTLEEMYILHFLVSLRCPVYKDED